MTRENYGSIWDIDHIVPLAAFTLSDPAQLQKALHFTNLQPMFKKHNKVKGSFHNGVRH